MKNFCLTSILILTFCAVSFAQTNQTEPCPKIDVSSPTSDTSPGSIVIFTVTIDKESEKNPIILEWFVSGGELLEGQGTATIKTQQKPEDAGKNITATVEAKFLPDGCKVTYSETAATWCPPEIRQVAEFSISASQVDKSELDNSINHLESYLNAQMYIIERFDKKTSLQTIKRKNQKIQDYLKSLKIDISRLTFINGYADKNQTQIFLVPSGASPPTCDDCEEIKTK